MITLFLNKFKIPTILGLSIIIFGIIAGVYLNFREQIFISQAAPDLKAQNINLTNITDDSVTISWQTNSATPSFITFGQGDPGQNSALEDQDDSTSSKPKARFIHYVTLKNLMPKTDYQFRIISGKVSSEIEKFRTAQPLVNQTEFTPVIGSVFNKDGPLNDGIAYLSIPEAITQSAIIKNGGNFLIPLSRIRKDDLSDVYQLTEETVAKLIIISEKGTANLLFKLKTSSLPLPPLALGQNTDLTVPEETPQPTPTTDASDKYDLNQDGKINSNDYSIILQNLGKNLKNEKIDLNQDGVVNQKDLDLMSQKLKNQ